MKGAKLPTLREVTAWVRAVNKHYDGPGAVALAYLWHTGGNGHRYWAWELVHADYGRGERLPGDDIPIDAVAIARRLRASARDAGASP